MQRTQKQQELCEVSIKINNSYNKTEFEVGRWRITSKMYRKQMCPLLRGKTNSRSVELLQFFVPLFGKIAIFIINIFIKTQVIFIFGDLFIASNTDLNKKILIFNDIKLPGLKVNHFRYLSRLFQALNLCSERKQQASQGERSGARY